MRSLILAAMMVATIAHADEGKDTISKAKVSAEKLTKAWSLKAESLQATHEPGKPASLSMVVRFEKDVSKDVRDEVEANIRPRKGAITSKGYNRAKWVVVYFLDKDNVVLHWIQIVDLEGEVTGKAGDAFRVTARCIDEVAQKVTRIELRHFER